MPSNDQLVYSHYRKGEYYFMVFVSKRKGETKDSLFRKFSRMFMDEQIVEKLRDIQFYKKPSRRRLEKERLRGGRPVGRVGKTKNLSKTRKTR